MTDALTVHDVTYDLLRPLGFTTVFGNPGSTEQTAGLLRELYALDVTAAEVTCGSCGIVTMVGETRLYGGVMGEIFRCASCDGVIRLVRTPIGIWLDMRGSQLLFARSAP